MKQPRSTEKLDRNLTTPKETPPIGLRMTQRPARPSKPTRIHKGKTPVRIHFIPEWAEVRGKRQVDFVEAGLSDKGTVSKWFHGLLPTQENIGRIAAFLELEEENALFRHPEDDWLARFLRGRAEDERARIKQTLELAFPRRTGTAD